jgi:hypothetical protein
MEGRLIDLVEDIGKGINMEQLAKKPEEDTDNESTSGRENEQNRK